MVVLHLHPSEVDPRLRGPEDYYSGNGDLDLQFTDFKLILCKAAMTSCANRIREDRACHAPGNCSDIYTKAVMPVTHGFCSIASDHCDDPAFDRILQKLYDAGALSASSKDTAEIDGKIRELNELKDKIKVVAVGSHADQSKRIKDYIEERRSNHAVKPKSSNITPNLDKELDEEQAAV